MAKAKTPTTIKLSRETKQRMDGLKEYERETYNELINKILNIINITIKNPIAGARIFRSIKHKKFSKETTAEKILARHQARDEMEGEIENTSIFSIKPVKNVK